MAQKGKQRAGRGGKATASKGSRRPAAPQRPRPPWHPLPAAELLILAGIVAVAVGVATGSPRHSAILLAVGGGAAVVGTLEVSAREHFAGYRSHALLLSLVPVALLHGALVLLIGAFTAVPREANLALLLFSLLWRFLRNRFALARAGRRLR